VNAILRGAIFYSTANGSMDSDIVAI
jgi:hypothetical protein